MDWSIREKEDFKQYYALTFCALWSCFAWGDLTFQVISQYLHILNFPAPGHIKFSLQQLTYENVTSRFSSYNMINNYNITLEQLAHALYCGIADTYGSIGMSVLDIDIAMIVPLIPNFAIKIL
jgi:hypothetical protein